MQKGLPALLLGMLVGMTGGCSPAPPEVALLIPVNDKCTTCEDFIRCDAGSANAAVYDPTFDIYRLEPKGTLAQLATVWHFLIQLFHTRTEDRRPLAIYSQRPGNTEAFTRTTRRNAAARTDLVQHRIYLPEGWIDQVTGEWRGADGAARGLCRLLPPAAGREALNLFSEPAGAGGES